MKLLKTFAVGLLAAAMPSMASAATTPIIAHLTDSTATLNCENLSKLVSGNSLFDGAPAVLVAPEPSAYALGICAMLLFLVLKRRRAIKAKLLN